MANFCTKCGASLAEGAKFCTSCGTPVAMPKPSPEPPPIPEAEEAAKPQTFSFNAPAALGETALGSIGGELSAAAAGSVPGPFKVIGSSIKTFISSVSAVLREPKKLIPALALAVIWLVLNILQAVGVESEFTDTLSFVSFAKGGMSGGVAGAVGGILGKGLFAGAVTMLIGRITRKRSGEKRSLISTLKGSFGVSPDTLWPYLTGAGAAMLIYLFISGGDVRSAFMAGLACSFLSGSAALNEGFVKQLLSSFVRRSKTDLSAKISGIIRGGTAGFAAAALIGLAGIPLILSILGGLLFIGGITMMILTKAGVVKLGKEAVS